MSGKNLFRGGFVGQIQSGALWNTFGFLARFLLGFLSSILFVRWLGQTQYGVLTFILSVAFFLGIVVNLGMGTVMTQQVAQGRAEQKAIPLRSMLQKVTILRLGVIAILAGGLWLVDIGGLAEQHEHWAHFWMFVPFLVLTTYFQGTVKTLLTAYYELKFINLAGILEMLIKLSLVMLVLYWGYGLQGFIIALLLSQLINGFQLSFRFYDKVLQKEKERTAPFQVIQHSRAAWNAFWVGISIRVLGRESDLFLLGILHSDIKQVAIYAVVYGVPKMVFDVFAHALSGGLGLTAFTELVKAQKLEELAQQYQQILHIYVVFLFPAVVGGMIVGNDLVEMFYGEDYANVQIPLSILFISLGISGLTPLTADLLFAFGKHRVLMRLRLFFGMLNILANILVIPHYGALGVAITTGLVCVALTLCELTLLHPLIHPRYPFQAALLSLIFAALMGLAIHWMPFAVYWKVGMGVLVYSILFLTQDLMGERRILNLTN